MTTKQDARREKILDAALETFALYGFRRTSLEDIANSAGVPRTAMYRLFKGKDHIFQVLVERLHRSALDLAEEAFSSNEPFPSQLKQALLARDLYLLEIGHTGPHADEIAELYDSLAAEVAGDYNTAFERLLLKHVRAASRTGQFSVPGHFQTTTAFVRLLRLSLEGVKKEVKSPEEFRVLATQMIDALSA